MAIARMALVKWRKRLLRRSAHYTPPPPPDELRIFPPAVLSFRDNFDETMAFLARFRRAIFGLEGGRHLFVDLAPLQSISIPVGIVLAAEFHRWSIKRGSPPRPRNVSSWSPRVRGLLSDLGVFSLLGIRRFRSGYGPDNVTLTRLRSGERLDGRAINKLQTSFSMILAGFTSKPEMYAGLSEAAENAIAHAYPEDYKPAFPYAGHRWWGASCLDLKDGRLRFFIFDHGAGIPHTVPTVSWYEDIRSLLAVLGLGTSDAMMLRAAFEVARSRTGQANRGLGLQRMADVVRGWDTAYLRVISGQGEVIYRHDDKIETRALSSHIGGTLIEWNMPADLFVDADEGDEDASDQHRK